MSPVAILMPHHYFDLRGVLPSAPTAVIEYDWALKKPSADDVCDGTLTIYAWLHVSDRVVYDDNLTILVDRWLLPQKFVVKYEIDTDAGNEVEYCPNWRGVVADPQSVKIKGYTYDHVLPVTIDEDPPNTDGEKMESTTTFKWVRSLLSLGSVSSPGGFLTPAISVGLGIGLENYAGNIHWILDLKSNLTEYDGIVQEAHQLYENTGLAEDFFCYVGSDDNSAIYKRGDGEAMYREKYRQNHRTITTP